MNHQELMPHLFRTEYRKIVAVLCKHFGLYQLEMAEDIASDTFLTAAQTWGLKGIPQNPTAWLYRVAKNKAKNALHRDSIRDAIRDSLYKNKMVPDMKSWASAYQDKEIDLSPQNIHDSQLQMMFVICHPSLSPEAQIGLALRILCGFGINEIADAFLSHKETINKRLFRAKEKLREENIRIEFPEDSAIDERLGPVLRTLYLLFNEGYYSVSQDKTIRKDLCLEAMRLCTMLVENAATNKPPVNALLALMCFHASRFEARLDQQGELILYEEQDTSLWNTDLISKGGYFLQAAATGHSISTYHLEAAIAYWHTQKSDLQEKWKNILQLYDQLLQIEYSPMAALNRIFALSKVKGKQEALTAAEKLNLSDHHFYCILLGELYTSIDDKKAKQNFTKALSLAKSQTEKQMIQKKIDTL